MNQTNKFNGKGLKSREPSKEQRKRLADLSDGACECCGFKPPEWATKIRHSILQAHHVVPIAKGGPTRIDNLVLLCPTCHKFAHAVHRATELAGRKQQQPFGSETERIHYLTDLRCHVSTAESVNRGFGRNAWAKRSYTEPTPLDKAIESHRAYLKKRRKALKQQQEADMAEMRAVLEMPGAQLLKLPKATKEATQ